MVSGSVASENNPYLTTGHFDSSPTRGISARRHPRRRSFYPQMSEDAPESVSGGTPETKPVRKRPARRAAKPAAAAKKGEDTPAPSAPENDAPPLVESIAEGGPAEPIAVIVEPPAAEISPSSKKRRRKKKKHGQQIHPHHSAPASETADEGAPPVEIHTPAMHAAPRTRLDAGQVAKKAWKIFLAEVGEEGLALINDHDAREISRRSFRLAEIFLEEEARRVR